MIPQYSEQEAGEILQKLLEDEQKYITYPVNRSTYVYVIRAGNLVKIGTSLNPEKRIKTIQATCPIPIETLVIVKCGPNLERDLHIRFKDSRKHGEWFDAAIWPVLQSKVIEPGKP